MAQDQTAVQEKPINEVAEALEASTPQSASQSIVVQVANQPLIALLQPEKREELYAHIQKEIDKFVPDVTTAKGRDAIKSLAFKITRTKTTIDAAGKELNAEAREKINVVDAARRDAKNTLTILAEQVRKPLTDWEAAEETRITECNAIITDIKQSRNVFIEDTAETVRARGKRIWEIEIADDRFGDLFATATEEKAETVTSLKASLQRLETEEAERAELERLRAAEQERIAKEEADAAAAQERERAAEAERVAEQERQAAAEAEAERIRNAEKQAAEQARIDAENAAAAERAEAARLHQQELDAERERTAQVERDAQAERDRVAAAEAEREAAVKAEQEQRAEREADQAHRAQVKDAARDAMMACGASNDVATKICMAILAGEIPAVKMEF